MRSALHAWSLIDRRSIWSIGVLSYDFFALHSLHCQDACEQESRQRSSTFPSRKRKMFSGWVGYRPLTGDVAGGPPSVLDKFPAETSRQIALSVVDSITSGRDGAAKKPILTSDEDVDWVMNVVAYGLRLPLEYDETIRKCILFYHDWLNVLLPFTSTAPPCVRSRPEFHACRIIDQFEGVFILRADSDGNKVAVHMRLAMCVLGIIQRFAFCGRLKQSTWNTVLHSLVRICDRLLAPPCGMYGTLAERIGESLVCALYNVWIKACESNFPSPALWKTLQEAVLTWRHQRPVVVEWTQICQVLTRGVVRHLYGHGHGSEVTLKAVFEDGKTAQPKVTIPADALVQCWYRFLLILGNPVELSRPKIVGKTTAFMQAALESGDPEQVTQHTCLQRLPTIFLLAQRGVASLLDLFLELSVQPGQLSRQRQLEEEDSQVPAAAAAAATPPAAASDSTANDSSSGQSFFLPASLFSALSGQPGCTRPALPKRSTLLHLFGEWLFQASLPNPEDVRHISRLTSTSSAHPSTSGTSTVGPRHDDTGSSGPPPTAFEAGRAEALACLCRVFCASCCGEQILPVYLARFYYVLQQGLHFVPAFHRGDVLCNLLMHSSEIFCNDLAGAFCLMPSYLSALELVLPSMESPFSCKVDMQELRHASTQILMSLLCVPVHFNNLTISDLSLASGAQAPPESAIQLQVSRSNDQLLVSPLDGAGSMHFADLCSTVTNLVFAALRCEKDPTILQMLLGSMMVMVQDAAAVEEVHRKENSNVSGTEASGSSGPAETGQVFSRDRSNQPIPFDAAAMCVRACRDVTQRFLRVEPGNNVHVTMSVLELMSGLAGLNLPNVDGSEWHYIVRWLCDFINTLVCQPPRAHSRDLHSMIVAAYHCLLAWTTCNHRLLFEQEPLRAVLDVCELGLTGSKSTTKARDDEEPTKFLRGEKEFRPVSRRVLEAAEMVLYAILEHLGAFPPPMGPGAVSSMLDEAALISSVKQRQPKSSPSFRYYAVDTTTLLGVLPYPVTSDNELPTVTIILRGPSGRHTWTMQLRQVPRNAQAQLAQQLATVARPEPHSDPAPEVAPPRQPWPDVVKSMPVTQADASIPSLQDTLNAETEAIHLHVQELVNKQSQLEHEFVEQLPSNKFNVKPLEMKPPPIRQSFQTTRLMLSHLGLVTPESLISAMGKDCEKSDPFVMMDSESASFQSQLQNIDAVPTRHTDTVYVLYVRPGQSSIDDILLNHNLLGPQKPEFAEFLNALGWPVNLDTHPGFKGTASPLHCPSTSGQAPMPYFADNNTEVLFVVPSLQKRATEVVAKRSQKTSPTDGENPVQVSKSETDQLAPSSSEGLGISASSSSISVCGLTPVPASQRSQVTPIAWQLDVSISIVWLERFEDWASFPVLDVSELTTPLYGCAGNVPAQIVFVHPLSTGLYRIKRVTSPSQSVMAGPLLSDMVVSRRSLGSLVRQTVINMAKRRRILSDNYSPPHALRKRRVEELCKGHVVKQSVPDFYSDLFRSTAMSTR